MQPTITYSCEECTHGHQVHLAIKCARYHRDYVNTDIHTGGPQSGDIRLFGDTSNGHGAVSIYSNIYGWQGICPDSSWTDTDADIICQDLGYESGAIATPVRAFVGPRGVPLSRQFYAANCPADNLDIASAGVCSFSLVRFSSDCTSPQDTFAAVRCSELCVSYRITNYVEIFTKKDLANGISFVL